MNKTDFYSILCKSSPEELNSFISSKGKLKTINGITFMTPEESITFSSDIDSKLLQSIQQINT